MKHTDSSVSRNFSGRWWKILSWIIMPAAYGYLAYVLINYKHYDELISYLQSIPSDRYLWLAFVLTLLPFNIAVEALKWRLLVVKSEKLSVRQSVSAVLAGFATGFLTPNRLAEPVGRVAFLQTEHRISGVIYSLLNSLTQNFVMAFGGLPALILFIINVHPISGLNHNIYIPALVLLIAIMLAFYFLLPKLTGSKLWKKHIRYGNEIALYQPIELLRLLLVSMLRYSIFCTQMFAMLHFFHVDLSITQALMAIPASYLLVTFTPAMAFSEAAVRSSYAVLFVGAFVQQPVAIALAGIALWVINFGIPVLAGAYLLRSTSQKL